MSQADSAGSIVITSGDPTGVGPELIGRILEDHPEWRSRIVLAGPESWVGQLAERYSVGAIPIPEAVPYLPGKPSVQSAAAALEAMEQAATGCREGRYSGVVTGPISKEWCQKAGMIHPGQTEFFASHWGGNPTMAFYTSQMVVSLVTWHVPLLRVWDFIDLAALTRVVEHTCDLVKRLGKPHPRIAVAGLNPHAGENGQIGLEEKEYLEPWIDHLQRSDMELSGPVPGDTVFYRHLNGEFDAVVALYHDQALAPVKTLAFHEAVNVTLGLRYVRTSPDHGTAFGIAGKGIARPDSFEQAIRLAFQLI